MPAFQYVPTFFHWVCICMYVCCVCQKICFDFMMEVFVFAVLQQWTHEHESIWIEKGLITMPSTSACTLHATAIINKMVNKTSYLQLLISEKGTKSMKYSRLIKEYLNPKHLKPKHLHVFNMKHNSMLHWMKEKFNVLINDFLNFISEKRRPDLKKPKLF